MNGYPIAGDFAPLAEIVESVANTVLGMDLALVANDVAGSDAADDTWSGCVAISGPWQGTVMVTCGDEFVARAARAMFSLSEGPVSHADASDTLGEIANIIGGNFKSLVATELGAHCQLSMPTVAHAVIVMPAARLLHRVCFDCTGCRLQVSIFGEQVGHAHGTLQ
jgi:chemotaxis protein CheX